MGARIPIYVSALRLRRSEPVVSDSCSGKSLETYIGMRTPMADAFTSLKKRRDYEDCNR